MCLKIVKLAYEALNGEQLATTVPDFGCLYIVLQLW